MKPKWDGKTLSVEFHKPDIAALDKARKIGQALAAMNIDGGTNLVTAIDYVLFGPDKQEENDDAS